VANYKEHNTANRAFGIVEEILCEFLVQYEIKKVATNRKPEKYEKHKMRSNIKDFVIKIKAETQTVLRKHQKVHYLKVSINHNYSNVGPKRKWSH
jgi:hypothetical protein